MDVETNYSNNNLLTLDVKQLNKIMKLNYFYTLKALWDDYRRMFRLKKKLSGKKYIAFCFKIAVMAPLTRVERAKLYRKKKIEKVCEREALRKKLQTDESIQSRKEKPRLLKERLYKEEYRKE